MRRRDTYAARIKDGQYRRRTFSCHPSVVRGSSQDGQHRRRTFISQGGSSQVCILSGCVSPAAGNGRSRKRYPAAGVAAPYGICFSRLCIASRLPISAHAARLRAPAARVPAYAARPRASRALAVSSCEACSTRRHHDLVCFGRFAALHFYRGCCTSGGRRPGEVELTQCVCAIDDVGRAPPVASLLSGRLEYLADVAVATHRDATAELTPISLTAELTCDDLCLALGAAPAGSCDARQELALDHRFGL